MQATQAPATSSDSKPTPPTHSNRPASPLDLTAPAGAPNSLGAESKREPRPATDDTIVEAMDEAGPGISQPLVNHKAKK
jgi:hypothetical protein